MTRGEQEAWMDGFTACACLHAEHFELYEMLRNDYLAARPGRLFLGTSRALTPEEE